MKTHVTMSPLKGQVCEPMLLVWPRVLREHV